MNPLYVIKFSTKATNTKCLQIPMTPLELTYETNYVLQKYITKNKNSLFIDKRRTNYCSTFGMVSPGFNDCHHSLWHGLIEGIEVLRGDLSPDLLFKPLLFQI